MSVPSPDVTEEANEKQETIKVESEKRDDVQESSVAGDSRTADSLKEPQTSENAAKDGAATNSSTPSDLSMGSSKKEDGSPNAANILDNTTLVAEHYNSLEEKGLPQRNQSRIVYMRNFNNWIKSMLINEFVTKVKQDKSHGASLKVLDMCCGKGGDLLKWKRANITHLICADIAKVSVEQCQNRYTEMLNRTSNQTGFAPLFAVEFITADCTKVRLREKYSDPSIQLDFVSCQFAFHYSFESLQQAECMLRNASECLRPGGYFIGTIPDAYDLASRWQKCDGNKFGNDVFTIDFQCENKTKPPLFGAMYNFRLEGVVDCPEFLVHLPTLCKLAGKFGLELVMFERFEDYYERMKDEGRSLLGKMQALETYPPYHEVPLLGHTSKDYQHAVQYMQNLPDHRKIGTLSQSEWEATSLYAVFAFQKMKSHWNSHGKMEYVKP